MLAKKIVRRSAPALSDNYLDGSVHPLLKRVYAARQINELSDLARELEQLLPFKLLLNIEQAALRLVQALKSKERLLIIGDFDADGATSTALAVAALRAMGSDTVDYLVPNRFSFGYGLTPEIVELAKTKNPALIITVDNGISSAAGVERAHALGIDVLITDHHLPAKNPPKNCIIVNPNQADDLFPSKALAGVGVIFYVMLALRHHLTAANWFQENQIEVPNMANFLDLVALGTVADVVPLDKNNRILVHQGLARIRLGRARPGLQALLQVAKRSAERLTPADLAFAVAPRLNAAGRLDDMSLGINCLLAPDAESAYLMALELDQLNNERREIEADMQKQAFNIVDRLRLDASLPEALCLYDPQWHQGVVGLVASRVKEKTQRPVIAFARVDKGVLKGSARSVNGVHIRDCLENIATQHPELLTKFGGHAMAAGLSLNEADFKPFSRLFAEQVAQQIKEKALVNGLDSDGHLETAHLNLEIAELLREAGPWGSGFPEPCFDDVFEVIEQRLVGQKHLKLLLKKPDSSYFFDAIAFNIDPNQWPNHRAQQLHCLYRLDINEYQGRKRLQLLVEELSEASN